MPPVNLSGLDALNQVQRLRVGAPLPNSDPTLSNGTLDADRLILRNTPSGSEANANNATFVVATLSGDVTITFPASTGTVMLQGGPATSDLDMDGNLILNIGAAGTDFTAGGGLTLAAGLVVSAGGIAVTGDSTVTGALNATGTTTVVAESATAFTVAKTGTDYALQVDTSTASAATGLKITSAAAAGGLALSVISSGTNENLTLDAKGSGTVTIGGTSTGNVVLSRHTTALSLALGTNPASAGIVRIPNNQKISARNAANGADVDMAYVSADNVPLWRGISSASPASTTFVPDGYFTVYRDTNLSTTVLAANFGGVLYTVALT